MRGKMEEGRWKKKEGRKKMEIYNICLGQFLGVFRMKFWYRLGVILGSLWGSVRMALAHRFGERLYFSLAGIFKDLFLFSKSFLTCQKQDPNSQKHQHRPPPELLMTSGPVEYKAC